MKIIKHIESVPENHKTIMTLGMFDGVHKGHQEIIRYLNKKVSNSNEKSCLLTFWPHPRFALNQDNDLKLLTLPKEKLDLLSEFNLDILYIQDFNQEFSGLTAIEFVEDFIIKKLNVKTLIIGHDHRFGKNREGNFDLLNDLSKLYGFELIRLEAIFKNDIPISSTKIRNALRNGNLSYANEALGYFYRINGQVILGDGIGKTLGFPTINLNVNPLKLLPKDGVYGVKLILNHKTYHGLLNIGTRPTLNKTEHRIEVYILDFEDDLYNKDVQIELKIRIRDEQKFENKEELIHQIKNDEIFFRNYLSKINH